MQKLTEINKAFDGQANEADGKVTVFEEVVMEQASSCVPNLMRAKDEHEDDADHQRGNDGRRLPSIGIPPLRLMISLVRMI